MKRLAPLLLIATAACGVRDLSKIMPEITGEKPKKGSTQMVFALRDHVQHPDGRQTFSLVALDAGQTVGFDLELGAWSANPPGLIDVITYECPGRLVSQGAASDAWLAALDRLYATGRHPERMAKAIEIRAVTLHENPGDFTAGQVIMTLLLPPCFEVIEDPQVHLALDLPAGRAYWRELHPQLRQAVVAALADRDSFGQSSDR